VKGPEGFVHLPGYLDRAAQVELVDTLRAAIAASPFFTPRMPGNGKPFSVSMSNFGSLGWVSDRAGYRYQAQHPETGAAWPPIPPQVLAIWQAVGNYPHPPEACLVNRYRAGARMGLHRDADENDFSAPVVSISLGDSALFRLGGLVRKAPTRSLKLHSGDIVVLGGEARLLYHGIDRVIAGTSQLLNGGGRLNLTLRRVTKPST